MSWLVDVHSVLRWLVLLAGVVALGAGIAAASGDRRGWLRPAVGAYAGLLTLQFVIGLALWLEQGRWDGDNVFFSWIHPVVMLLAVGAAHAGLARVRRADTHGAARRAALLLPALSLVLVLAAIPW